MPSEPSSPSRSSAGFAAAQATGADWRACVQACLAALDPPPDATLGFAYFTDELAADAAHILQALREGSGVAHWVGTVALGVCGGDTVHFDRPALSIMLASLDPRSFKVFAPLATQGAALDADSAAWLAGTAAHVAVVHADQHSAPLDTLIARLVTHMDGGFLVGGIGSARQRCPQLADGVVDGGLSGVLLAEQVAIVTRLTQGCSPIGPRRSVTRGGSNIILELDGRPALDVFKEDIGEVLARDLRRVAGYIFAGFTVRGSDTGAYLVRNLLGIDPDSGALAVGEMVSEGDQLLFCRRDPPSAVQDMQRMLGELQAALGGRRPRGGLYVSCLARGPDQFDPPDLEIDLIRRQLGEFPLTGFFANGEIAHDRLYGYTGVLTLFL